jgi:hypothetical protein
VITSQTLNSQTCGAGLAKPTPVGVPFDGSCAGSVPGGGAPCNGAAGLGAALRRLQAALEQLGVERGTWPAATFGNMRTPIAAPYVPLNSGIVEISRWMYDVIGSPPFAIWRAFVKGLILSAISRCSSDWAVMWIESRFSSVSISSSSAYPRNMGAL